MQMGMRFKFLPKQQMETAVQIMYVDFISNNFYEHNTNWCFYASQQVFEVEDDETQSCFLNTDICDETVDTGGITIPAGFELQVSL